MKAERQVYKAVELLPSVANMENKNLQMPGDGRYQPADLKPYLGYDMWAAWLILVEWFWLKTLAKIKVMPKDDAKLLTSRRLLTLLKNISTTLQDIEEKRGGGHDILALLALMRQFLPKELHRWLHYCATSYDIINTAYALQIKMFYESVFMPKAREIDVIWREFIRNNAETIQIARTHLQRALPGTVGHWLSHSHNRFVKSVRRACKLSNEIPGKFTGATGTSASQRVLIIRKDAEKTLLKMLGLPKAEVTTQITSPEETSRFYNELVNISGALSNFGDDIRILQMPEIGEVMSVSSSSSAMSHKDSNPIAAEQDAGMNVTVVTEFMKLPMTLTSNLYRDLKFSNVMRSYSAVAVYTYQQMLTTARLLKSLRIISGKCLENFKQSKYLVVAELLHLSLQREGVPEAHKLVNEQIVPIAKQSGKSLWNAMEEYLNRHPDSLVGGIWPLHFQDIEFYLLNPEFYIGDATEISQREAENKL